MVDKQALYMYNWPPDYYEEMLFVILMYVQTYEYPLSIQITLWAHGDQS